MNEKTYICSDGTLLNFNAVKKAIRDNLYICTIKNYRSITNCLLKEAKDAIDSVTTTSSNYSHALNYDKCVDIFRPFFVINDENSLETALIHVIKNWKVLGFENRVDACQTILNNFKRDS